MVNSRSFTTSTATPVTLTKGHAYRLSLGATTCLMGLILYWWSKTDAQGRAAYFKSIVKIKNLITGSTCFKNVANKSYIIYFESQ